MNIKILKDSELINRTEELVKEERNLLTHVLNHLREIDRRRLYSSLGYKSLFDFTVKHLNYPEDQAYRRISAMKLMRELPEIEEKIAKGKITLTHISLAHSLFRQEAKLNHEMSNEEKLNVFEQIASKPVREAERITLSLSTAPQAMKPDQVKCVSENEVEMKFLAPKKTEERVIQLKAMLAHSHPNISLGELFTLLCDLGLKEWDKTAAPRKRRVTNENSKAELRRVVFRRARNQCEICKSHYALEIDHIRPRALGGTDELENLRVLCRSCNQRAAIKVFGAKKMEKYLDA